MNPDRQRALHWLRRYRVIRREWLVKKELMEDVTGLDMARHVEAQMSRLRGALTAADAPGRDAEPVVLNHEQKQIAYREAMANLAGACAYLAVRSVANARWAVNEHVRNERLTAALQGCWDEYEELMSDALRDQAKEALGIREFVAEAAAKGGGPSDG